MKSIFDKDIRAELIERIEQVNENNIAQWGEMNVFQMLKHNTYWNNWVLGKDVHKYKQGFLGMIFGKMILNRMVKSEHPIDKNIPTSEQFKIKESSGDIEAEKSKWTSMIKEYEDFNNPKFIHDFFGKMTKEQIGILTYKHTDHHLRQFGA